MSCGGSLHRVFPSSWCSRCERTPFSSAPPLPPAPSTPSDVDDEIVKQFIGYEKGVLATYGARLNVLVAEADKIDDKDPAATLAHVAKMAGVVKELEADEEKQRQANNIT